MPKKPLLSVVFHSFHWTKNQIFSCKANTDLLINSQKKKKKKKEQNEGPRILKFFSDLFSKFLSCPMYKIFGLDFFFRNTYKLFFFSQFPIMQQNACRLFPKGEWGKFYCLPVSADKRFKFCYGPHLSNSSPNSGTKTKYMLSQSISGANVRESLLGGKKKSDA